MKRFLSFLLIVFLPVPSAWTDVDVKRIEINVFPQSIVRGETYSIGDIATMEGFDVEAINVLAATPAGRSPLPGVKQMLSASRLRRIAAKALPGYDIEVALEQKSNVVRQGVKIDEREVNRILDETAGTGLKILSKVPNVFLPEGEIVHEVRETSRSDALGYSNWMIDFQVDGKPVRKIYVRTLIKKKGSRPTKTAEKQSPSDSLDAPSPALDSPAGQSAFSGTSQAVHPTSAKPSAKMRVATSKPKTRQGLQRSRTHSGNVDFDVNRGKKVVLRYVSENLELKTIAKSMQSGRIGDVIQVRNLSSNKIIDAEIVERNSVKVVF